MFLGKLVWCNVIEKHSCDYVFLDSCTIKLFTLQKLLIVMVTIDLFSRGDTQEFADLNKLAKRFLRGTFNTSDGEVKEAPSRAYVQEVVEELRKGEQGECPICLEAFEDAVLTPCAHRLCRECLLASMRNATSGLCPVCRYYQAILLEFLISSI